MSDSASQASSTIHSVAVVAVTRRGSELACRLAASLADAVAYLPSRFATTATPFVGEGLAPSRDSAQGLALHLYDGRLAELLAGLFAQRAGLILVMATGAAVRLVAPLLQSKVSDPPVVVVDDGGRFAISLLSGHAGGANRLAEDVARAIGAQPVITTASEQAGVPSIEQIARDRRWKVEPGAPLTRLAAALVNGEPAGVYQDAGPLDWLPSSVPNVHVHASIKDLVAQNPAAALVISDKILHLPKALAARTVVCRPPVLILGIGCSSGTGREEIAELVDSTLLGAQLSPLAVAEIATIDRRQNEPGLLAFAQQRGFDLRTFSATELDAVEGDWTRSAVVRSAVGAGGVAEPAALAAADATALLVRKVKSARVTLAIARGEESNV